MKLRKVWNSFARGTIEVGSAPVLVLLSRTDDPRCHRGGVSQYPRRPPSARDRQIIRIDGGGKLTLSSVDEVAEMTQIRHHPARRDARQYRWRGRLAGA